MTVSLQVTKFFKQEKKDREKRTQVKREAQEEENQLACLLLKEKQSTKNTAIINTHQYLGSADTEPAPVQDKAGDPWYTCRRCRKLLFYGNDALPFSRQSDCGS